MDMTGNGSFLKMPESLGFWDDPGEDAEFCKNKKRARIKIQPRFKIQYPMKNRDKTKHIIVPLYTLKWVFFISAFFHSFISLK